jgi:tetratricopeptide (TPR) repeat protein
LAHHDLGLAQMTLGNNEEALEEFRKETEVNPSFAGAYLRAGTIELDHDQLTEAEAFLRQATARDPGEATAHFQLARCYLKLQRPEAA